MPSFCFSLLNSRWYNYLYHLIATASTLQPTSALSTHFFFFLLALSSPSATHSSLRPKKLPPGLGVANHPGKRSEHILYQSYNYNLVLQRYYLQTMSKVITSQRQGAKGLRTTLVALFALLSIFCTRRSGRCPLSEESVSEEREGASPSPRGLRTIWLPDLCAAPMGFAILWTTRIGSAAAPFASFDSVITSSWFCRGLSVASVLGGVETRGLWMTRSSFASKDLNWEGDPFTLPRS